MAQILVPTADQAAGSWTTTPLWSKVDDDSTVNATGDGTTITSDAVGNNTDTSNADLQLAAGSAPQSGDHIIRARWNHNMSGRSLQATCELWQGVPGSGTLIATLLSATDVGTTEVENTHTLTAGEVSNISDYSDLYLRLRGRGTGGGPARSLVVDLVELEIPDAAGGGGTTVTPATIAAAVAVPGPSASGAGSVFPSVVAAASDVPGPSVSGGAAVSPAVIGSVAAVPTPDYVGGGGAGFPSASLEYRFEAKDETAYSDGQEATTVTDQSGNSRDLTGSGVTWESGELNGHAVYRFDGIDDDATDAELVANDITAVSVSIVVKAAVEGSSRTWPASVNSNSTSNIMAFTEGETASEWGVFARSSTATVNLFTSGVDTTEWTHLLLVWDGATVSFYRDGSLVDSGSLAGDFDIERWDLGEFVSQFFGGDLALAAGWSKALDATERSDLQDYVESTYFPTGGTTVTPAVIATTSTVATPTATGAAETTPAVVATTTTLPTPTPAGEALAAPAAVATTSAVPTPDVAVGKTVSPDAVVTVAAFPTPTPLGEALVTVAVIATTTTVPTPSPSTGTVATPDEVATTAALPTPTPQGETAVSPAVILTTVTVATPVVSADVAVSPDAVATVAALSAPAAVGGTIVSPDLIATLVDVLTPLAAVPAVDITAPSWVQFQRIGSTLVLAQIGRGGRRGHATAEGFERVSEVFTVDNSDDSAGHRDRAMISVASAWAANSAASAAVLKDAIDTALQAAGFRTPGGGNLT